MSDTRGLFAGQFFMTPCVPNTGESTTHENQPWMGHISGVLQRARKQTQKRNSGSPSGLLTA